uniref:Uncharacterized protein n=1 Tax=Sphaerodactylus townsendi TaxID=933632 RepID=A0ACB8FG23_9SAUR
MAVITWISVWHDEHLRCFHEMTKRILWMDNLWMKLQFHLAKPDKLLGMYKNEFVMESDIESQLTEGDLVEFWKGQQPVSITHGNLSATDYKKPPGLHRSDEIIPTSQVPG